MGTGKMGRAKVQEEHKYFLGFLPNSVLEASLKAFSSVQLLSLGKVR